MTTRISYVCTRVQRPTARNIFLEAGLGRPRNALVVGTDVPFRRTPFTVHGDPIGGRTLPCSATYERNLHLVLHNCVLCVIRRQHRRKTMRIATTAMVS